MTQKIMTCKTCGKTGQVSVKWTQKTCPDCAMDEYVEYLNDDESLQDEIDASIAETNDLMEDD